MNRGAWLLVLALAGCGGTTDPDPVDGGGDAGSTVDTCDDPDGTACGEGRLCIGGLCTASTCGDEYVDTAAGEECDDGNEVANDGCQPSTCTFTCHDAAECDDREPCNGTEECTGAHVCDYGEPLAEGAACTEDGLDGVCSGSGTTAFCAVPCTTDADCFDGSVCDDVDTCDLTTELCTATDAPACEPGDPCHSAVCDDVAGCMVTLMDADGDGAALDTLGECGRDCNDNDPSLQARRDFYVDCDMDGYVPTGARMETSCGTPNIEPACANGVWITVDAGAPIDCDDANAARSPAETEVPGDAGNLDEDCSLSVQCYRDSDNDGNRTPEVIDGGSDCGGAGEAFASEQSDDCCDTDMNVHFGQASCFTAPSRCGSHDYNCSGGGEPCDTDIGDGSGCFGGGTSCTGGSATTGWIGAPPGCGEFGDYVTGCEVMTECDPERRPPCFQFCAEGIASQAQACR